MEQSVSKRRRTAPALAAHLLAGCAATVLMFAAPAARAQDLSPDVQALIDGLSPDRVTRGIRLPAASPPSATPQPTSPPPARTAATASPILSTTAPRDVAAVSLTVTFETGSATLTPQAERMLDTLARALASPQLASFRFRIEGHTDSVGSRALNQELSERRATAVCDYLRDRHRIDPSRLEAVGLGEQQLLINTPDETPEPRNRRVQVINLGG